MMKYEIVNALARERNLRRYLEICTPTTGGKFSFIDPAPFAVVHRLMYRCPENFDDGMPVTFRSGSQGSEDILRTIHTVQPEADRYDIIFVDSYHSYRASIADLHGALCLLRRGGVMVVHDCNPTAAAIVKPEFQEGEWCGVTYQAFIDFVLVARPAWHCVVDSDYGCGVVFSEGADLPAGLPSSRPSSRLIFEWSVASEDDRTRFGFFERHRKELINLISPAQFRKLPLFSKKSHRRTSQARAKTLLPAARKNAGAVRPAARRKGKRTIR